MFLFYITPLLIDLKRIPLRLPAYVIKTILFTGVYPIAVFAKFQHESP